MTIESIKINSLFGNDFNISINDNKLIIVADNGSGKTTILRIIYFFLTKQWSKIIEFEFDQIITLINGKKYTFNKSEYLSNKIQKKKYNSLAKKYSNYSNFIIDKFSKYDINDLKSNSYNIEEIEQKYDVPKSLLYSLIDELEIKEFDDSVYDWNVSVIYLPTYRRIEKDYFSIYGDIDKRVSNYILTLFPEIREKIKNEKYDNLREYSETEEDIDKIFSNIINSRNSEKWLRNKNNNEKLEMIEFGMNDVNFKIKEFYKNDIEIIGIINEYCSLLNKYLNNDKSLIFNEDNCELIVYNKSKEIYYELNLLSSGEKQLISLFSHLFFDEKKPFVIIDEPEISLSISWQEMILDDIIIHSDGIIAATHSPFIVNKQLREYTCGINEFLLDE